MSPLRLSRQDLGARALVLVGLVLYVGLVYVVVVLGGGLLIDHTASPDVGLSILATAIVAFGFERVKVGLERLVIRFLLGGQLSPYDVLSKFSLAVSGTYASEEVAGRMAKVLAEGTGTQWAQVWLMVQGRLALAATWPAVVDADDLPPGDHEPPGRRVLAVRQAGEVLGVLRLQENVRRPMTAGRGATVRRSGWSGRSGASRRPAARRASGTARRALGSGGGAANVA